MSNATSNATSSFFARLSAAFIRFITQKPWYSLALSALILGGIFAGFPYVRANFTHTAYFRDTDPALQRFNAFERTFGNDDTVAVVVHSPSGVFDPETATLLRTLTDRMWKVPEVIRVDSLANFQWVHAVGDEIEIDPLLPDTGPLTQSLLDERKQIVLGHELLPGYLVSKDAKTALVYARIKPGIDAPPDATKIAAATRDVVDGLRGGDHSFYLTGGPIITDAFRSVSEQDLGKLVPLLLAMVITLLIATFRSVGGVVMPLAVILTTVASSIALAGFLNVEMSPVTMALPQTLIAVCVAESVHLLSGFYRARRAGLSRVDATTHTLQKNLLPTFLTSITTAFGFWSFVTAELKPVEGFGLLAGFGTTVAWLMTFLLVGPLMVIWPGRESTRGAQDADDDELHTATPRSIAFVSFVDRYRIAIIAAFAGLTVISGIVALENQVNSNPFKYFAQSVPVRVAQDFVLEHVSGIPGFEVVVDSGREDGVKDPAFLRAVESFEKDALQIPEIGRTVSLVDILRQTNRALNGGGNEHYTLPKTSEGVAQELLLYTMGLPQGMDVNDRVSIKNDALRVTMISKVTDSNRAMDIVHDLEQMAQRRGLRVQVTGKQVLYQSMNEHVVNSFISSLWLASLSIGVIMLGSFRSIRLGLVSMIPSNVPLVVGGAALYILSGNLDIGTVLVASVSLGIAVDNTIHVLSNYVKHLRHGDAPTESLAKVMAQAGPAMISTTLILIFGFSTLALGSFVPNVYFGLLTAIILAIGSLSDLVLLPALLLVMDRKLERTTEQPSLGMAHVGAE